MSLSVMFQSIKSAVALGGKDILDRVQANIAKSFGQVQVAFDALQAAAATVTTVLTGKGVVFVLDNGVLTTDPTKFNYNPTSGAGGGTFGLFRLKNTAMYLGDFDDTNLFTLENGTWFGIFPSIHQLHWMADHMVFGATQGLSPLTGNAKFLFYRDLAGSDALVAWQNIDPGATVHMRNPALGKMNIHGTVGTILTLGSNNDTGADDLVIDTDHSVTANTALRLASGRRPTIAGAISSVTDANARTALRSIVDALKASNLTLITDTTS